MVVAVLGFRAFAAHCLAWTYDLPMPITNIVFEVWHSTNPTGGWTYFATTNQPPLPIATTNRQEFFIIRAIDIYAGQTSEWSHL